MSDESPPSPTSPSDRDEALLEWLREVVAECDPVPEHVIAGARSALAAVRSRADAEPPRGA